MLGVLLFSLEERGESLYVLLQKLGECVDVVVTVIILGLLGVGPDELHTGETVELDAF